MLTLLAEYGRVAWQETAPAERPFPARPVIVVGSRQRTLRQHLDSLRAYRDTLLTTAERKPGARVPRSLLLPHVRTAVDAVRVERVASFSSSTQSVSAVRQELKRFLTRDPFLEDAFRAGDLEEVRCSIQDPDRKEAKRRALQQRFDAYELLAAHVGQRLRVRRPQVEFRVHVRRAGAYEQLTLRQAGLILIQADPSKLEVAPPSSKARRARSDRTDLSPLFTIRGARYYLEADWDRHKRAR